MLRAKIHIYLKCDSLTLTQTTNLYFVSIWVSGSISIQSIHQYRNIAKQHGGRLQQIFRTRARPLILTFKRIHLLVSALACSMKNFFEIMIHSAPRLTWVLQNTNLQFSTAIVIWICDWYCYIKKAGLPIILTIILFGNWNSKDVSFLELLHCCIISIKVIPPFTCPFLKFRKIHSFVLNFQKKKKRVVI